MSRDLRVEFLAKLRNALEGLLLELGATHAEARRIACRDGAS